MKKKSKSERKQLAFELMGLAVITAFMGVVGLICTFYAPGPERTALLVVSAGLILGGFWGVYLGWGAAW